jgi:hypothetical protein
MKKLFIDKKRFHENIILSKIKIYFILKIYEKYLNFILVIDKVIMGNNI